MDTKIFIASIAALLAGLAPSGHAQAIRTNCGDVAVVVHAASRSEAGEACRAAGHAARFLGRAGLVLREPIELHVVRSLPQGASTTCGGLYLRAQRRAYVLRRADWPSSLTPFALPMTAELHRSAIVHEVAHAIVADHFTIDAPDVTAQEYFAYVVQVSSLSASLRARVMQSFPATPRDSVAQLNLMVLGMNPDRFATLAWRHWTRDGNQTAFLRDLLEGRALGG